MEVGSGRAPGFERLEFEMWVGLAVKGRELWKQRLGSVATSLYFWHGDAGLGWFHGYTPFLESFVRLDIRSRANSKHQLERTEGSANESRARMLKKPAVYSKIKTRMAKRKKV